MTAQDLLDKLLEIPEEERVETWVFLLPIKEDGVLQYTDYRSPLTDADPWIELR